jgi:hypothetical protein
MFLGYKVLPFYLIIEWEQCHKCICLLQVRWTYECLDVVKISNGQSSRLPKGIFQRL